MRPETTVKLIDVKILKFKLSLIQGIMIPDYADRFTVSE